MKIEAIEPHGLCAGVNAAISRALALKNVYCLHALVHNEIVVDELRALGFKFVERIEDVPEGETVVFSAHGVSPQVRETAAARRLKVVDTTCPFVARAHRAAKRFSDRGLPVVILGDPNHDEVKGIAGEVETPPPRPGDRVGVVSQTTMNADEVAERIEKLRRKYVVEGTSGVCQATKERQDAVRAFCAGHRPPRSGALGVLVLGSGTSANSRRLAQIAAECGARAFLAGTMDELEALDFGGVETLGVTSGASTPERFFDEAMKFLRHVPRHVAIIMDGNGRWATRRGKRRGAGHVAGADTLGRVLEWCGARGIQYLTVYAFSTENWKRPKEEVDGLMKLFAKMLKAKTGEFMRQKVRFRMIGRRGDLSESLLSVITRLEEKTRSFSREFIVAISYGGRAEIVDAVNAARTAGEPLTEETFRRYLYAPDVPDPDLVIRTSGELRTSNFLIWEAAYSEYHFTDVLWPDFSERDFDLALEDYASRHRRRGGV
ncbi:MAG: di-trans,poly-cis-decaprenylcistransferase [Kiritimatiellae bacterium]|nr:di-trans,poly-cis-decaprenylcistransferase [Kiritimatiellia bacterium]